MLLFTFKEGIKAKLRKEVESDLAQLRNELDTKKEIIKNDLQRDAYKAQLMLNNIHSVYPELASNLEVTSGAVGRLQGLRFSTNFEEMHEEDIISFMESKKFPRSKRDEVVAKFQSNKKGGAKVLSTFLREVEIEEARQKCIEANNFRILKSIYCSESVLKAFDDCYSAIWSAWVDLDIGRMDPSLWKKGVETIRKEVPSKMDQFRQAVRSELRLDE